jgi:hypothetical protein
MIRNGMPPPPLAVGEEPPPLDPSPSPRDRRTADQGKGSKAKGKTATRGRFQCINAFIDATMAELTLAERSTWFILWRDTKPNGLAETSQASIARRAGVSDRAVRKALARLTRLGLVGVIRRGSLRRGPSSYRVFPLARQG